MGAIFCGHVLVAWPGYRDSFGSCLQSEDGTESQARGDQQLAHPGCATTRQSRRSKRASSVTDCGCGRDYSYEEAMYEKSTPRSRSITVGVAFGFSFAFKPR